MIRISTGKFKNHIINTPVSIRPTENRVREAVFNILYSMIDFKGKSFGDFFAGSGAVGIEALSRGFNFSFFVDKSTKNIAIIKENLINLGIDKSQYLLLKANLLSELKTYRPCDVVFMDPPYKYITNLLIRLPFYLDHLILPNGIFVLEYPSNIVISDYSLSPFKIKNYGGTSIAFFNNS